MFEARIIQGKIIKSIIEAIRELVTDANLDCNEEQGISMQVCNFKINQLYYVSLVFISFVFVQYWFIIVSIVHEST